MIRKYEIMYILDQDLTDLKPVQEKINKILTEKGGKIIESADWGLKEFAYEIKHKKKGYYSVVIVETDGTNINELERISRIDKNIIRLMVVNTESEKKYIQSTKLSKTDMTQFKEEKKMNPRNNGPRQFDRKDGNRNFSSQPNKDASPTKAPTIKKEDAVTSNANEVESNSQPKVAVEKPAVKKETE